MNHRRQFDIAEELLVKQALMDKIVDSVKQHRPFNTSDAAGASKNLGIAGAGLGALLGGGSAALQGAFMDDEDEEGRENNKPSILGRAVAGAGIGGLGGLLLPQLGIAAKPYQEEHLGEHARKKTRKALDDKYPPPSEEELADMNPSMRTLSKGRMGLNDTIVDGSAPAARMAAREILPEMTISDILKEVQNAKAKKQQGTVSSKPQ